MREVLTTAGGKERLPAEMAKKGID